jgi:hypothetical protein
MVSLWTAPEPHAFGLIARVYQNPKPIKKYSVQKQQKNARRTSQAPQNLRKYKQA